MNLDRECRLLFTKSLSSKIKKKSTLILIQVNSLKHKEITSYSLTHSLTN